MENINTVLNNLMGEEKDYFFFVNKSKTPSIVNKKIAELAGVYEKWKDKYLSYILLMINDLEEEKSSVTLEVSDEKTDTIVLNDTRVFTKENRLNLYAYLASINKIFNNTERDILIIKKRDKMENIMPDFLSWLKENMKTNEKQ